MTAVIYRFDTTLLDLRFVYRSALLEVLDAPAVRDKDVALLTTLGPRKFARCYAESHRASVFAEELTHAVLRQAETCEIEPLVFGARVSVERLRAEGISVLLESSLPRPALSAILERIGWRGRCMYDAVFSEEDSPDKIRRLLEVRAACAEHVAWVCGARVELVRAEEIDPSLKVLVEDRLADGSVGAWEGFETERVLVVPTVALVPELLTRVSRRHPSSHFFNFGVDEGCDDEELFVA
jgi:phosphoglycolate phosphatase-like HAD superfamily hydrolase